MPSDEGKTGPIVYVLSPGATLTFATCSKPRLFVAPRELCLRLLQQTQTATIVQCSTAIQFQFNYLFPFEQFNTEQNNKWSN